MRDKDSQKQSNAPSPSDEQKIRITHPFHPLRGQSFPFVVSKPLWGERRVTVQMDDGRFCSLPIGWTELASPEPYLTIGEGRSRFRVEDLLELAEQLKDRTDPEEKHVK